MVPQGDYGRAGTPKEPDGMSEQGLSKEWMIETERGILGDILIDNRQFEHFKTSHQPFSHKPHMMIFNAMVCVKIQGEQIDIVTLSEQLKHEGRLEKIGGVKYLADLSDVGEF